MRKGGRVDALKYALGANAVHGQRRSNADKRRCVEIAVKEFGGLSSRAIAELCGVSNHFVDSIRPVEVGTVPTSRTGADGKQYPATRATRKPTTPEEEEARTYGDVRRRQPRRRDGVREVVGVRHGRGLDTGAGVRIL